MSVTSASVEVISGAPYEVVEVAGHPPQGLPDFVGSAVEFLARRGDVTCQVVGDGVEHGSGVRLHQKVGGTGKDVRVWLITVSSEAKFEACTESAF